MLHVGGLNRHSHAPVFSAENRQSLQLFITYLTFPVVGGETIPAPANFSLTHALCAGHWCIALLTPYRLEQGAVIPRGG